MQRVRLRLLSRMAARFAVSHALTSSSAGQAAAPLRSSCRTRHVRYRTCSTTDLWGVGLPDRDGDCVQHVRRIIPRCQTSSKGRAQSCQFEGYLMRGRIWLLTSSVRRLWR
ncbi:hypothetical protein BD626DRAFT_516210 [Schizophyllum amplum]|uniref:Uncharacterized protein n=1 Tax=Schizophyllum amplum TaxID=97359 RepID=A0A550BWY6_9AGAR|nr:hypothetical protein BD626DRAFT_516210 [Auriculariopsis ampla]